MNSNIDGAERWGGAEADGGQWSMTQWRTLLMEREGTLECWKVGNPQPPSAWGHRVGLDVPETWSCVR